MATEFTVAISMSRHDPPKPVMTVHGDPSQEDADWLLAWANAVADLGAIITFPDISDRTRFDE